MADPKRQQIMEAVDARLQAILASSTAYKTYLGNNVFEWRSIPLTEAELPAIIYRDTEEAIAVTVGKHEHYMTLEIELALAGETAPEMMREGIADVVTAIGTDRTWGGLAEDTEFAGPEAITVIQNERRLAGVVMRFVVTYLTNPFDAYA